MPEMQNRIITTEVLGMAFEPEQKFENPDGSPSSMALPPDIWPLQIRPDTAQIPTDTRSIPDIF